MLFSTLCCLTANAQSKCATACASQDCAASCTVRGRTENFVFYKIFSGEVRHSLLCVRHIRVFRSGELNLHNDNNNYSSNSNNMCRWRSSVHNRGHCVLHRHLHGLCDSWDLLLSWIIWTIL